MVVNLCQPHFEATVQCNKLCADGYDVSNLLSVDAGVRARGFRLEYFLRPPVHVTLSFKFRVEVCRVDVAVWPQGMDLGQASRGLEIYTSSDPLPQNEEKHKGCGQFRLVGRCELKEGVWVSFAPRSFRPRPPFLEHPPDPPVGAKQQELWSRGPQSLSSVTQLRVSLPYGGAGSQLGLKALAVWGLPAHCCPSQVLERIVKVHQDSQRLALHAVAPPKPSTTASNCTSTHLPVPHSDVPQEFLDPLTQEVMTQPLLLPSGVIIDSSSLEEYQRQEAKWGRPPNDPFTGVPFSSESQPLPSMDLKSRIDHFLLQDGAVAGRVGQLGRAEYREVPLPSTLITSRLSGSCLLSSAPLFHQRTANSKAQPCSPRSAPEDGHAARQESAGQAEEVLRSEHSRGSAVELVPAKKLGENPDANSTALSLCSRRRALNKHALNSPSCKTAPSSVPRLDSTTRPCSAELEKHPGPVKKLKTERDVPVTSDSSGESHEQRLADSLDQALNSALKAFPAFNARRTQETVPGDSRCGLCSCAFSTYLSSPSAFRLPCGHLLCRPCLTTRSSPEPACAPLSCPTCCIPATPSSVTRVHY